MVKMTPPSSTTVTSPSRLQAPMVELLPDVKKGSADWREYRPFRLPNGVTCMVVHDKESKTTAMAACVHTGAAADPRRMSGLAHFCEHMVFLGSEKWPGENDYKKYLANHGGRSNGSTSLHLTTYKFEVIAEHAETAVDIFANFFTCPLFTASGTSREVNAVDSENSKNLVADARRRLQILKALADPEHYFSKFTTGNAQTLPTHDKSKLHEVREALLAFHRHHYRPENLTVVLVGPQTLDTLQEWLVPRFVSMQPRGSPSGPETKAFDDMIAEAALDMPNFAFGLPLPPYKPAFRPSLQPSSQWPVLLTVQPLRPMRQLTSSFPTPSTKHTLDQNPMEMLGHLLGHEGRGSCFALLQDRGWLTSLSAGPRVSAPDHAVFQINIGLTQDGEQHWKDVVDVVLAHARLIHAKFVEAQQPNGSSNAALELLQELWSEVATLKALQFNQTSPSGVYSLAPALCQSIVSHGTEEAMSTGSMLNETPETFPLAQVAEFASLIAPSNCIVERCSPSAWDEAMELREALPDGFGTLKEQWYGIDYHLAPIEDEVLREWEGTSMHHDVDIEKLHLPHPNHYIPKNLELCGDLPQEAKLGPRIEKDIDPPNLLVNEEGFGRLWHRLDDRYALPKSSLTILLRNAAVENRKVGEVWEYDVDASIRSSILSGIFSQALAQDTYDADLAGLSWTLTTTVSGIRLAFGGYSDRLPDLATKVLKDFLLPEQYQADDEEPSGSYFRESYFESIKDKLIRNFRTYFESRRADAHAAYYRDLLMSSQGKGLDVTLKSTEVTTLDDIRKHHEVLLQNKEMEMEIFFSGNVSERQARELYNSASDLLREATGKGQINGCLNGVKPGTSGISKWVPAPIERRLVTGQEVELHFASKNPEEENGAVVVTYQSQIPGFKGDDISPPASLKSSASIRLLCHMLREPLFNNLRTKQQLGYIVSSSYDLAFSSNTPDILCDGPWVSPVEFIIINVLSRKVPPPEVKDRIDEFLEDFRDALLNMPESEIRSHASALSKKLLKPTQKLGTEASNQFGKIRRYGPEIFHKGGSEKDIPWNSVKSLAHEIQSMQRQDLVDTYDRVFSADARARVVSCVYGTTFPLEGSVDSLPPKAIVNNVDDVLALRNGLKPFDMTSRSWERIGWGGGRLFAGGALGSRSTVGFVAAAAFGAGYLGMTLLRRPTSKK